MDYEHVAHTIRSILKEKKEQGLQEIINLLYNQFPTYTWVGIYLVKGANLHLGPWAGKQPTEHTIIPIGHGICGSAAQTGDTEVIPDVHKDHRYLSCFLSTRSEIVVPIKQNHTVIGEIDIDSDTPNAFTQKDVLFLEKIADIVKPYICNLLKSF